MGVGVRRAMRWGLVGARAAAAIACVAIVVAWVFGRVATDRWGWSQYLWWVPTVAWGVASVVLLSAWWGLAALGGRIGRCGGRGSADGARAAGSCRRGRWARVGVLGIIVVMVVWAGTWEWRVYRFVAPVRAAREGIRIASWNPAVPVDSVLGILEARADVYLFANRPGRAAVGELKAALGEGWRDVRADRMTVVSSRRVVRWGTTRLGLEGRVIRSYHFRDIDAMMAERVDDGRAMFVELEAPEAPEGTMVVWLVDLPSDPRLWRGAMMETAARALATWEGRVYRFDEDGGRLVERVRGGFPAADVIVGDFNTPRGSWSLSKLVGGMRNAWDEAGRGYGATFPRWLPVSQIDLMFVGQGWEVVEYGVMPVDVGHHLGQVGEVVWKGGGG